MHATLHQQIITDESDCGWSWLIQDGKIKNYCKKLKVIFAAIFNN